MRETRVSVVNSRKAFVHEEDGMILSRACDGIRNVGRDKPDIILLSELFANHPAPGSPAIEVGQTVPGPISEELSSLARQYHTYIAFGLLRRDGNRLYNSLVLLDRNGKHVWTYDKVTPTAGEMEDLQITPGSLPKAFDCDFGRIGGAICFDINFHELAECYFSQGVELLLFSSAFPAGRLLDSWAVRYGFAIAGSTWYDNNRIIDCTGSVVGRTSDHLPCVTSVLNLNRRVVHMDWNLEKLDRMRAKYPGDVLIEDMRDEAVCVITSLRLGLEVSDLIKEFEVETLPEYWKRSRRIRREHGGLQEPVWW